MNLSQRISNPTIQSNSPMIRTRCFALPSAGWYHGKWIACLNLFFSPLSAKSEAEREREILHQSPHCDPDKVLAMYVERMVHLTCELWMFSTCNSYRKRHTAHIQAHSTLKCKSVPRITLSMLISLIVCSNVPKWESHVTSINTENFTDPYLSQLF